jgi:hypothetical protein
MPTATAPGVKISGISNVASAGIPASVIPPVV